jgi:hypothetical protein
LSINTNTLQQKQFAPNLRKLFFAVIALGLVFLPLAQALAAYSQANVISDSTYLDKYSMDEGAINSFLVSQGSWLANYTVPEYINVPYPTGNHTLDYVSVRQIGPTGELFYNKTVAKLVYDKAQQFSINPRVLLTTLQKESTAITRNTPSSDITAAWPMFYAFNDSMRNCYNSGSSCNSSEFRQIAIDYGGVGQQIAYSMYFFNVNYGRYLNTFADPITIDGQVISCETVGTRVLYRYTPSISGQSSFYNIFTGWWGSPNEGGSSGVDDTTNVSIQTYEGSIRLAGTKRADHSVRLSGQVTSGGTSWQYTVSPPVGSTNYVFEYLDGSNNVVGQKIVTIVRQRLGDINNDGRTDILDLSIFSDSYGKDSQTADPMADLNADSKVDILDLSIFANNYQ